MLFWENAIPRSFLGVLGTKGVPGALCDIGLINEVSMRANIVVYLYLADVIMSNFCILVPTWNKRYKGIPVYVLGYSSNIPSIIFINTVVYLSLIDFIFGKVWYIGFFSELLIRTVFPDAIWVILVNNKLPMWTSFGRLFKSYMYINPCRSIIKQN